MTTKAIHLSASKGFIFLSAISLAYVAVMAIINPQAVMDLVGVKLPNNDSISSIRGIYGGVGITLVAMLCYLAFYQTTNGLIFLTIFWGSYVVSRIVTRVIDGPLGEFGTNWLVIESCFCLIGVLLLIFGKKLNNN
ncbi:MAG TPA: DUF4345 domain-containing protein [Cyclobacteriaceae bacterium]|nr:DUF4345 domain-containing protein [Cyclobacteriaceae bacterium]